MASEKNLNAVFTDIANAIRGKKGTTDQIKPINMAQEIVNLPSGGGETVELSVTQNGIYTPDEGTTYSKVSVNVPQTAESGTIKSIIDAKGNADYLFYQYGGISVAGMLSYSDTSNATTMNNMFYMCDNLTNVTLFDTSKVTSMSYMFNSCKSLTTIPQFDTSNVTNMGDMFRFCHSLVEIPLLDTSKVTNMGWMFEECKKLTAIPNFDTSKVTSMQYMFKYCVSLETIPQLDTSNATSMGDMFNNCSKLTSIPKLNTSKVINMTNMFSYCYLLTTIPELDVSNVKYFSNCFNGCRSLKSILMYGMKADFDISASTQFGESDLVTILNNLATVTSTKTLTMGSTNLAKLTDEEKAIATNKGWTLK